MSDVRDIAEWWAEHPMTYANFHGEVEYKDEHVDIGSPAFFEHVDQTFYRWNQPLHDHRPFGKLFPYDEYRGKSVLELGCGMGTMGMNWARQGANYSAVDLTPTAVQQTRRRFELYGLSGDIRQADARQLPFPDASFDYVYSWGVLMCSPELDRSIAELMRVLKPGGGFGVMLYYRHSFLYGYMIRFVEGFLHNENRYLDALGLASRYTDGAQQEGNPHMWPITKAEAREIFSPYSRDLDFKIYGTDLDGIMPYVMPGVGRILPAWFVKPWARRFGWSLWIHGHKA